MSKRRRNTQEKAVLKADETPETVEEPTPKPKRKPEYKKTLHMSKDRFGNPRSQRDFESTLRPLLNAEESGKAWKTWSNGGTVTLVLKK